MANGIGFVISFFTNLQELAFDIRQMKNGSFLSNGYLASSETEPRTLAFGNKIQHHASFGLPHKHVLQRVAFVVQIPWKQVKPTPLYLFTQISRNNREGRFCRCPDNVRLCAFFFNSAITKPVVRCARIVAETGSHKNGSCSITQLFSRSQKVIV